MNSLSDEILSLLNDRQEAAFELVFRLYYPRLVYFAKEYINYEDAKGLVQEAFMTLWEKNPSLRNESQLQSYLYTVVKNKCLMQLRHEKIMKNYAEKTETKLKNQICCSALEQLDTSEIAFKEIQSIIGSTLSDLPSRCREVFILSRIEGMTNREVADRLDISVKAVEAQITKALVIFREALKDYLPLIAYFIIYL